MSWTVYDANGNIKTNTFPNPVPVTSGGTGTSTQFTQGSVVFAGASGTYSQDNAQLFWDDTNFRLGVGTGAPGNQLTVKGASGGVIEVSRTAVGGGSSQMGSVNFFSATNRNSEIAGNEDGATNSGNLSFLTQLTGGGLTEIMRITASGVVSIGASPNPPVSTAPLFVEGTTAADTARFYSTGTKSAGFQFGNATTGLLGQMFASNSGVLNFISGVGATSFAIICAANGNVGIAGNTPADALDVGGNVRSNGLYAKYNNILTAGWGVPAIYGSGRATGQTGAVASVAAYTVGASDGSFLVSMNILMTAFTAGTVSGVVTYTDESNTARSLTMNFSSVAGTLATTAGAVGAFEGVPLHIRVKASTAITCTTTVAGFTGTYNVEGMITQIA